MGKVDLSEFYKLNRPKKKPCKVGYALTQLPDDISREQLNAALEDNTGQITVSSIMAWLEKRNLSSVVSVPAVTSHRKRQCTCYG